MKPSEQMARASSEVNGSFVYRADPRWNDRWRILDTRKTSHGDCDDYALTVAALISGGLLRVLWAVLTRQAQFWYCYTQSGESHLVLRWGNMWIDNIRPWWSYTTPHKMRFRAPLPLVVLKMVGNIGTLVILQIILALLLVVPANAETCAPSYHVREHLTDRFGEAPAFIGLGPEGETVIELWHNRDTGTFTVTATNAHSLTCLIASGTDGETAINSSKPIPGQPG